MMAITMNYSRSFFFPLLLVFILLFAQQAGAVHTLRHDLEDLKQQQDDTQAPHSNSCQMCSGYAHLGSALSIGFYDFLPLEVSDEAILHSTFAFRSVSILAATARGPPAQLQRIA
jgi:hypothetical protein